jgi:hypothetical protein
VTDENLEERFFFFLILDTPSRLVKEVVLDNDTVSEA